MGVLDRTGLRGWSLGGVAVLVACYAALLAVLQWSFAVREKCLADLVSKNRYQMAVLALDLESRRYLDGSPPESANKAARQEDVIRAKLRGAWALSRLASVDGRGVGLMAGAFGRARLWLDGGSDRMAERWLKAAARKAALARLKSGRDLGLAGEDEVRRELMERIMEIGGRIAAIIWALAVLTAVAGFAATWWSANRLAAGLDRLRRLMLRAADGRLEAVPVEGIRELRELSQAFNEMVGLLGEARTRAPASEDLATMRQLALGVSHAISNPLFAIIGYADILIAANGLEPRVRGDLERIRVQAERCQRAVGTLMSAPAAPRALGGTRLDQVIRAALAISAAELRRLDVSVRAEVSAHLPEVAGDGEALQRAVSEILLFLGGRLPAGSREVAIAAENALGWVGLVLSAGPDADRPEPDDLPLAAYLAAWGVSAGEGAGLKDAVEGLEARGIRVRLRRRARGAWILLELPARV